MDEYRMNRRRWLGLAIGAPFLRRPAFGAVFTREWLTQALKFDEHWNRVIRFALGCPETGDTTKETCKPGAARDDWREFTIAKDWAQKVFGLKEE